MKMLRRAALAAVLSTILAAPAIAAVPGTTLLEGVLHATGGGPAADGDYKFTFSVYGAQSGGTAAWTEKDVSIKVTGGRFAYALGSTNKIDAAKVNALPGAWLGIAVGADPELPRQPLHSAVFAMHAKSAGSLTCTDCVGKDAISNGSITSAKVQFAYAKAADGIKGGPAADLKCTGCVSVSEIKWDGAVNMAGQALTAGKITSAGDIVAGGVVAGKQFVGDGSKLTGINIPAGSCPQGQAVVGIEADGKLKCASSGIAPDNLNEVSNDLLTNQFTDTIPGPGIDITDNNPSGVLSTIDFPDIGIAQDIQINLTLENSEINEITAFLFPPNAPVLPADRKDLVTSYPAKPTIDGTKYPHYLLHRKTGSKGAKIDTTYPAKTKPVAGDIHKDWIGKNPKGQWRLLVVDSKYLNNQKDGKIVKWSISLKTLSNKKVAVQGNAYVGGTLWGTDNGHGVPGGDVQIGGGVKIGHSLTKCDGTKLGSLRFHPVRGLQACTESHKRTDNSVTYHWTAARAAPVMWSGGCNTHYGNSSSWRNYCLDEQEINNAAEYFDVHPNGTITIKISGYYRLNFHTIQHGCHAKRLEVQVNGQNRYYVHNDVTGHEGHRWQDAIVDFFFPYKAGDTVVLRTHSGNCNPYGYHNWDYGRHSRFEFHYEGPLAVGGTFTKPQGETCNDIKTRWPESQDGLYWIDPDGASGKDKPMEVYCDMTTDGGGWTLAAWMPRTPNHGNLPDLRCGGGWWWDARTRNEEAALPAVNLARKSKEILFSRSGLEQKTGNIMTYDVVTKFPIPKPEKVNFINHSQKAGHKGTGDNDRGPCVAVKIKVLKGASVGTNDTRYTYQNVLGASWTDSHPSGYGAVNSSNCGNSSNWSQGPFFQSRHAGATASNAQGCPSNGKSTYNHKNHWDPTSNGHGNSAAIWFK